MNLRLVSQQKAIFAIVLAALLLRLAVRMNSGSEDFWTNGYTFYFALAQSIAADEGLALEGQPPTAFRVPLYPMFLAALTQGRQAFLSIVIAQSLIGAATVLCLALLTTELFDVSAGTVAALLAATYPYYVVHDTAMQETALFTFLTLLSVLLLIRTRRSMSCQLAIAAGLTLAAAVLTRASIAPFALVAPLWLGAAGTGTPKRRVCVVLLFGGALTSGITPWLVRSYILTGSPVLATEIGFQLWQGNNPYTFSHYPVESIDLSTAAAIRALSEHDRRALNAFDSNEVLINRWYRQEAMTFIRENPWVSIKNAFRKVWAAFSWLPSPRRNLWPNIAHFVSYGTIMILGALGMVRTWRSGRRHSLIHAVFVTFALVVAVFFGHTSHRSFLDVYWMVYAAAVIARSPAIMAPRRRNRFDCFDIQ
jgi:4-amino-4-deoxy-L-arabinose transferase-like glycosyltransferase